MKKLTSALASLLIVASLLTSCSGGGNGEETTTAQSGGETTSADSSVETEALLNYQTLEADWNGEAFRVMTIYCADYDQFTNFEVFSEGENGDIVNDAVYRRNSTIEEKFNVHIVDIPINDTNKSKGTDMYLALTTNIMSGEDAAELFFIALRDSGSVMAGGLSRDLYTLPYIDFDAPYYSSRTNDMISMDGKLLLTTSDFSLVDKKRAYALIYNRKMLADYSDLVLEDLVRDGTWTYDTFIKLCESVSSDLDGNGVIDNNDQWGVGMDSKNGVMALAVGMGLKLIDKDSSGMPVNNTLDQKTVNIVEKLYTTLNENKNNGYHCFQTWRGWKYEGYAQSSTASTLFREGRQLFVTSFPQSLSTYSAVEGLDYGILAWPKYDETQDAYYSFADYWGATLFGVPYIASKTDLAGFMIEALSGYSTETSLQAYYEVNCKVKHVYDETSAEMLDLCLSGRTFDLGVMFDWGGIYDTIFGKIIDKTSNTYVSDCEAVKDTVANEIADTLEAIANANQG